MGLSMCACMYTCVCEHKITFRKEPEEGNISEGQNAGMDMGVRKDDTKLIVLLVSTLLLVILILGVYVSVSVKSEPCSVT